MASWKCVRIQCKNGFCNKSNESRTALSFELTVFVCSRFSVCIANVRTDIGCFGFNLNRSSLIVCRFKQTVDRSHRCLLPDWMKRERSHAHEHKHVRTCTKHAKTWQSIRCCDSLVLQANLIIYLFIFCFQFFHRQNICNCKKTFIRIYWKTFT